MATVPRAVIFDLGGVLLRTEDPAPRRRLEAQLGLSPGQAEALVFHSPMGRQAQMGRITAQELWQWVGHRLGLTPPQLAAFRAAFWAGDRLDRELVALIRRLRPRYQTALLSNAFDDLRPMLTETLAIADAFDTVVISAEEGAMKPDPAIYRRVLERLGRKPDECVFVDDFLENVEGARRLGLAAIHYVPGLDVSQALAELGIRVSPPPASGAGNASSRARGANASP